MVASRSCHVTDSVERFLRQRGVEPNVVFQSDDNGTLQAAVAAGLGIAIFPRLSLDARDEGVRLIQTGELPWRTLALAWHRDRYRSPASQAFQASALAVCASLAVAA
jgi:DNA-binding transcriptional LysR family regulator